MTTTIALYSIGGAIALFVIRYLWVNMGRQSANKPTNKVANQGTSFMQEVLKDEPKPKKHQDATQDVSEEWEASSDFKKVTSQVILLSAGEHKLAIVREVKRITGADLKTAREMVEDLPQVIAQDISKTEAQSFKNQLVKAGATVEVR